MIKNEYILTLNKNMLFNTNNLKQNLLIVNHILINNHWKERSYDLNLIEKLSNIKMFIICQSKSKGNNVEWLLKWLIELEKDKWYAFCNIYISKTDWLRYLKILTVIKGDKLISSYSSKFATHLPIYYKIQFPNNKISLIQPSEYDKIKDKKIEISSWNILFPLNDFYDFINSINTLWVKKNIRYKKISEADFNKFKKDEINYKYISHPKQFEDDEIIWYGLIENKIFFWWKNLLVEVLN